MQYPSPKWAQLSKLFIHVKETRKVGYLLQLKGRKYEIRYFPKPQEKVTIKGMGRSYQWRHCFWSSSFGIILSFSPNLQLYAMHNFRMLINSSFFSDSPLFNGCSTVANTIIKSSMILQHQIIECQMAILQIKAPFIWIFNHFPAVISHTVLLMELPRKKCNVLRHLTVPCFTLHGIETS